MLRCPCAAVAVALLLAGCTRPAARERAATDESRAICLGTCHGGSENAAPPKAVGRDGASTRDVAVGAHQLHLHDTLVHRALACEECHVVPSTWRDPRHMDDVVDVEFRFLGAAGAVTPSFDTAVATCTVYCHGASLSGGLRTTPGWTFDEAPVWSSTLSPATCQGCHGSPPPPPHPASATCHDCHPATVRSDGRLDLEGGAHLDGALEVDAASVACGVCHAVPPASGSHGVHYGDQGIPPAALYGDLRSLLDYYPGGADYYMFGCGDCHPLDGTRHMDGVVEVELSNASAPAGSLKALSPSSASYVHGTCANVYCHSSGDRLVPAYAATPAWGSAFPGPSCGECHAFPPPAPHPPMTSCSACHPATVAADGTLRLRQGNHVNGRLDGGGGACGECHAIPPATGAHTAHYGESSLLPRATYGDLRATAGLAPGGAGYYLFGCGNCHPSDGTRHMDGVVEVELVGAGATPGSLKALNPSSARFAGGTCADVYCHSSGQAQPTFVTTPAWAGGHLAAPRCAQCHRNPPRYPSGGAGTTTANSHLMLTSDGWEDGWETGHFAGLPGPHHLADGPYHGDIPGGRDAAPITCQTCHYATVDPSITGPGGFYYLDTTGDYDLGGAMHYRCGDCHTGIPGAPAAAAGGVLTAMHVNGARDVDFDPRESLPASVGGLPTERPVFPYWVTLKLTSVPSFLPPSATMTGNTWSVSLAAAHYDPSTKTCTSVACHLRQSRGTDPDPGLSSNDDPLVWGAPAVGRAGCAAGRGCHQY